MIIDSHQHFWNKDELNYAWLTPELGVLYRNYLPEELYAQVKRNGVEKTVVVQAAACDAETDYLLKLAGENDFIGGIVGWVDLLDEYLDKRLEELSKNVKFKGVRHQIEDEPDREWMLRPAVLKNLKVIERIGLAFDALLKQDQLWQLEKVFEAAPELRVVIDHCAKPDIAAGAFDKWAGYIRRAAKLPVCCKLSGLMTEADIKSGRQTVEDIRRYSDCVLEAFGENRVMFGSDWPVSAMAMSYDESMRAVEQLLNGCTPEQIDKIMYANAKRFYRL